MNTKIINLIGAPGTGKSTIASQLFAIMKWNGFDVELVSEYAKDLVWEKRDETIKNQIYIFGKQHQRIFRLLNKVEYIITDSPLLLSNFYNEEYNEGSEIFRDLVFSEVNKMDNFNFFLNRTKPYVEKGRNQTEDEANEFSDKIKNMLKNNNVDYLELNATDRTAKQILSFIY